MDFFDAQEHARKQTRLLVFLFGVAVVAIIGAVYLAVTAGNAYATGEARFDPGTLVMVALFTGLMIGGGSAFRISSLRQGGGQVARMLGGREVPADTTDLAERRLLNVVEEMAVASGTPVPEVYIMDREEGINAFAAGYSIHDAAVAVTRGTLDTLTRDELQGVIAHEFSHIMNGDMRLNIRLIGLLHGILLLAIVGRGILYAGGRGGGRGRGGGGGGAGQIAILGIVLLLVGYIGVIFGKLIKAAISRQREYLADSSAVQFTRNPDGIAGALKKIGGQGSRIRDHHAEEASHMFFASGLKLSFGSVLATHPPLEKRIRRIDPTWDGDLDAEPRPESSARQEARQAERLRKEREEAKPDGIELASAGAMIMASIGAPKGEHIRFAAALLRSMPEELRDAVHDQLGARAVVYALLLHGPDEVLTIQREILETDDTQLAQPTREIEEASPLPAPRHGSPSSTWPFPPSGACPRMRRRASEARSNGSSRRTERSAPSTTPSSTSWTGTWPAGSPRIGARSVP